MNDNGNLRLIVRGFIGEILSENKRDKIIEKVKLPDFVADWIVNNISNKFWKWFSNDFKKSFLEDFIDSDVIKRNAIKQMEEGNLSGGLIKLIRKAMTQKEGEYRYISDWLHGRSGELARETDKINFNELTFDEALERAQNWHNEVALLQGGQIEDEDGDVVITFPDGYYWINLGTNYCEKEGESMGHCGSGEGNLFSLRKDGVPYITADILESGIVRQMRGRANTKPKKQYHPYIKRLIKSEYLDHFKYWNYKQDSNFWLQDLGSKDEIKELIKDKPSLFDGEGIDNIEKLFSPEEIKDLVDSNPNMLDSLYIRVKYGNRDSLSDINSQFQKDGVLLRYDGWDDTDLTGLFGGEEDKVKEITSEDFYVDWNNYYFTENLDDLYLPEISPRNIEEIKKILLSKAGKEALDSIKSQNDLIKLIDNEPDLSEVGKAIRRALASAHSDADYGEYFNLVKNAVEGKFGEHKWEDNMLTFKITYDDFLNFLNATDDDEDFYSIEEFKNNSSPEGVIGSALGEYGEIESLDLNIPYNGVEGDVDDSHFNERLDEELGEVDDNTLNENDKLLFIVREIVSTEFSNDGQGGMESQTGADLMGYWHGESGPIHQGSQPAEDVSKHIYFDSGGGNEQSQDQTDAASESGAKEQVATGIEESEDVIGEDGLKDYILKYQKKARDMKSSNFVLEKMHKVAEDVVEGEQISFKIKSGKYESRPVELLVNFELSEYDGEFTVDKGNVEISVFLNGDFVEKIENPHYFLFIELSDGMTLNIPFNS